MVAPDSLVILAGFVLAHAAWSVSDVPKGELLVPLAVVEKNGQRQLLRFEAQSARKPTSSRMIATASASRIVSNLGWVDKGAI